MWGPYDGLKDRRKKSLAITPRSLSFVARVGQDLTTDAAHGAARMQRVSGHRPEARSRSLRAMSRQAIDAVSQSVLRLRSG